MTRQQELINRSIRKRKLPKLPPLSLKEQDRGMMESYPQFLRSWDKNKISWVGEIQPAPLCGIYKVKVCYSLESPPKAVVLSPKLERNDKGEAIPHTYGEEELCLYYPKRKEWDRHDSIAETIIPWISEWLFFYEIWHTTGEWKGGGIHVERGERNIL